MKKTRLKKSTTHGNGLFAEEFIRAGELIFSVDLSKYPLKDLNRISPEEALHLDYAGHGRYVVSDHPYAYINHSCDPNVEVRHETIARSKFFAMKDIPEGTELTYDYGVNALDQIDQELWRTRCNCGMEHCRGTVSTCFLNQPLEIQKRYYRNLPPSVKRKYRDSFKHLRKRSKR